MTAIQVETHPCLVAGEPVASNQMLEVAYPYTGEVVGRVAMASGTDAERAIDAACSGGPMLEHWPRHAILERARELLEDRREAFAESIRLESGLCRRETVYEVGRALDVLRFAAIEALREEGTVFGGDVSPQGKARRIITIREPLRLMLSITPFNHPLNQVVHKLAPAIAAGVPTILKPSEKTPLTALRLAELLYEAGLPPHMLSVLVGPIDEVVTPMVIDERVELVSFTGGTAVGRELARIAGYKRLCLELGGNSPLIIHEDADLELAVRLAAEGCFRNSGQRCTAVKRLLVHEAILQEFTDAFVERAREYVTGDPAEESTRVGTVIDEEAAMTLQRRVHDAEAAGARILLGGSRNAAMMEPTVIADVPRDAEIICEESFGPLAPIISFSDLDDAIELANASRFGLSTGIVSRSIDVAIEVAKRVRTGTVNVNEVPGWRTEASPFGGVKESGLGIKEGVVEAMKFMSTVKSVSIPW